MNLPRASGLLLHPTSLPDRQGIGDLGPEAHPVVEFLAKTGRSLEGAAEETEASEPDEEVVAA
jgi:4-alpha-glucanotransferase